MPTARQRALATSREPMGVHMRYQTYCTANGGFEDEWLLADFASAKTRVASLKSAMAVEAPLLVNSNLKHPNGGRYLQHHEKALSKHNEMEAREAKFNLSLMLYKVNLGDPLTVFAEEELIDLRSDMIWLLIVRESYDGWDWKRDEPRR